MKAFFAFSAGQDLHRVQVVIERWQLKGHKAVGLFSKDVLNELLKAGEKHIKKFIEKCIEESIVTVVLLDTATSDDKWVRCAVQESHKRNHGLMAVHVHNIPDEAGQRSKIGNDRFGELDKDVFFWQHYSTYRWVIDGGPDHICKWVEEAYQKAALRKDRI